MSRRPKFVSLIVSTYNWPDALDVVLGALARQKATNFEVVVADDGSSRETGKMIEKWQADFPVPLCHVWQEDRGFRAAAARNRAVAESRGEYLIFLDGDCVVLPDFVSTHARLAEPGWFVAGNRILLDESLTTGVLSGKDGLADWSWASFLQARLSGKINRLLPLLRLPDGGFRKMRRRRWQGAMTCNLAVWRDDFYRVNGFDEAFVGWGHEDAEFVVRLINSGIYRKEGRFATPILHLWHASQDRGAEADNLRRLHERLAEKATRVGAGVDRYGI